MVYGLIGAATGECMWGSHSHRSRTTISSRRAKTRCSSPTSCFSTHQPIICHAVQCSSITIRACSLPGFPGSAVTKGLLLSRTEPLYAGRSPGRTLNEAPPKAPSHTTPCHVSCPPQPFTVVAAVTTPFSWRGSFQHGLKYLYFASALPAKNKTTFQGSSCVKGASQDPWSTRGACQMD
jgi:hypothetical protein